MHRLALSVLSMVSVGSMGLSAVGCATTHGQGGPMYQVRVATLDGLPTAARGPSAHPACVLQVGSHVASVWLANPSNGDRESPVILEADAASLKDGILVERSWSEAVVHRVTDAELVAGAAVVYVPGARHLTTVELRFDFVPPVPALGAPAPLRERSDQKDDLAKHRPGLEQPVSRSDLH